MDIYDNELANQHRKFSWNNEPTNVEQQILGEWLIHGTRHTKDNQSQSLKDPCRLSYLGM